MARIVATTDSRKITAFSAELCTGEKLSNSCMTAYTDISGRYTQWKADRKVTGLIAEYWAEFEGECDESDTFITKVRKFGLVWREHYTQCRLLKPFKIACLNELFIKFEREVYGGSQLPSEIAIMITKDRKFINMTKTYREGKKRRR